MTFSLFIATVIAGFTYSVIPGPAVLLVFSLAAQHGRAMGAKFLIGHMAGDVTWSAMAFASIVGVSQMGPLLFDILGAGCGLYLIYLGIKAVRAKSIGEAPVLRGHRPYRAGFLFGLTNPKAYPVAVAVFTALIARYTMELSWSSLPLMGLAAWIGIVLGYAATLFWAGLPIVRRFFLTHGVVVTRIIGVTFVLFGLKSLADAGRSFQTR
ncbi:LysE family translocator [Undibacter mobilis]|uniref:LysE family translocator n=1 Tax=Undibacter mobilis TaxID=2292256 RepID=A0A371B486_9BRAD|nr:LysE family translocator [Undibacter mobilis]RDV02360.1 LysE family translocator [Undibacter mobilis]